MIAIKYVVLLMLAALLLCLVVIGWSDYRQRRLLNRLDKLLDAAMNGSFCEQTFDESMMSALESKLARYLAYSETSAKHVQAEKDKIKALITDILTRPKRLLPIFCCTDSYCRSRICRRKAKTVWRRCRVRRKN